MPNISVKQLRKEISQKRNELHAVVNGDIKLLLDQHTYCISTQLDELIVRLMKTEMQRENDKSCI